MIKLKLLLMPPEIFYLFKGRLIIVKYCIVLGIFFLIFSNIFPEKFGKKMSGDTLLTKLTKKQMYRDDACKTGYFWSIIIHWSSVSREYK